jgi:hypothetical protein
LKFGFETLRAETIWAGAGDWNKGSCLVLEKIGRFFLEKIPKVIIQKVSHYARGNMNYLAKGGKS